MKKHRVDQKAFGSNFVSQSFEIGPGHRGAQKKQKIYNKGKGSCGGKKGGKGYKK